MKNIDWPPVSVIVITRGRHEMAKLAVASILAADYPIEKREIVVVEETGAPCPMAGEGVKYAAIPVRNLGFPYARNKGVSLASADIVAFTDDDCLVEREWLKELVRPLIESSGNSIRSGSCEPRLHQFGVDAVRENGEVAEGLNQSSNVAAVAGAVLVSGCGAIGECENILGFPGGGAKYAHRARGTLMRWFAFSTCNCAVRRSALEMAGGFCEKLKSGGEDSLLSEKILENGLILFNPRARVCHKARDSFTGVLRWFIRRGRASVELARIVNNKRAYIAWMVFKSILLRLAAIIWVCFLIGELVLPVVGALALLYYTLILWRFRWARSYCSSIKTLLLLPVVKTVMDTGMDLGVLSALIAPGE